MYIYIYIDKIHWIHLNYYETLESISLHFTLKNNYTNSTLKYIWYQVGMDVFVIFQSSLSFFNF